jgi:hypothetical protein
LQIRIVYQFVLSMWNMHACENETIYRSIAPRATKAGIDYDGDGGAWGCGIDDWCRSCSKIARLSHRRQSECAVASPTAPA